MPTRLFPRHRSWFWPLLLASIGALPQTPAAAQTVNWSAPPSCPSEREVRETVGVMLARSIQSHDATGIRADARVTRTASGFVLDLLLVSTSGRAHEQLLAARCESLAGVVALKVLLAADPGAWFVDMQQRATRWMPGCALRVAASAGPGMLPGLGVALELTARMQLTWAGVEIGAGYGLRSDEYERSLPGVGAALDLSFLAARLCWLPRLAAFELPVCAGADAGLMRGRGLGVQGSSTSVQPWVAAAAGPALRWAMTPFSALHVGLDGIVSLVRPSYRVLGLTPERIYAPTRFGARVRVGVELSFE